MPLYIPWLTETIKKRGVRYLLHHYLGQFFEEKLTLEQLSIDIYEGKGSIRDLALDVDGLNDELDFVPFKFLEGCSIGQISVEVPWSSLATEACRVELDGAKFVCRLKTSADVTKTHCTESTLLSRSLMTSSMQMAEDIVTTEDDDEYDSAESSIPRSNLQSGGNTSDSNVPRNKKENTNQMFEGLEMFAQLIDSVLRRTKLTARNTLFQIQSQSSRSSGSLEGKTQQNLRCDKVAGSSEDEEFSEPIAKSDMDSDTEHCSSSGSDQMGQSENTVEFFIRFFRCEEIVDQASVDLDLSIQNHEDENKIYPSKIAMTNTVTKLLTLEDVEMRIDGIPVSNLIGKHTITIKFNGQKSEISVFSGSPLLAVIGQKQLETFFNVFVSSNEHEMETDCSQREKDQPIMSPEDYAKIESQLLETAPMGRTRHRTLDLGGSTIAVSSCAHYSSNLGPDTIGGRRWVETGNIGSDASSVFAPSYQSAATRGTCRSEHSTGIEHQPAGSQFSSESRTTNTQDCASPESKLSNEPTLDSIEAFSCEMKIPGIWLCILRDSQKLPPLIKPHADSTNSFQSINKYIDEHIKVPHIRCLALKVALDMTATNGANIFLGDLDISEYFSDDLNRVTPIMKLLQNDVGSNIPLDSQFTSRYKASIRNRQDITLELLTSTRMTFDPTIIDRIVYDYKLIKLNSDEIFDEGNTTDTQERFEGYKSKRSRRSSCYGQNQTIHRKSENRTSISATSRSSTHHSGGALDLTLNVRGEKFKIELLCPIPDLTPEASLKPTLLRPQSFIFDFNNINLLWQSEKLSISCSELCASVKTQPMQSDNEAVRFIESTGKVNDKITLVLEPSPSNLDNAFTSEIERALNESTLYDSIYVSQATESHIPTKLFQTKRKLVRGSIQTQSEATYGSQKKTTGNDCDHEKILTPSDRQHLLDYLNQTLTSTRLSLKLHLPICGVEFEDKEQLDLIYNRFGNDFVFWQPKAFSQKRLSSFQTEDCLDDSFERQKRSSSSKSSRHPQDSESDNNEDEDDSFDNSYRHSSYGTSDKKILNSARATNGSPPSSDCYDNQVTCKLTVDELFVRFNHQSCAAALRQEISADNLLVGIVIDVDKKPNTLISLVADNFELSNDCSEVTVLEGNFFADKTSTFALTAEIKRPTKSLKDIKLAVQLRDGLFSDFKLETYSRFWQSINVTDEPIMGFQAPQILTEIHVDILDTSLMLIKDGARPSLVSIDELYLTSMVMEQTSQVMIRLIADEISLYMKRDREGLEVMKNYVCLIESGLIDLDVKISRDGQLEFRVINNVITVRVCQDSLNALCRLFNILIRSSAQKATTSTTTTASDHQSGMYDGDEIPNDNTEEATAISTGNKDDDGSIRRHGKELLQDAMNDYAEYSSAKSHESSSCSADESEDNSSSSSESLNGEEKSSSPMFKRSFKECASDDDRRCILDESNPRLGDLFSPPLVPTNWSSNEEGITLDDEDIDRAISTSDRQSHAMDESGFFVIGDDDVGAGIIDKNQHHDPMVRKLIDGPINIVENHFKMTKPRALPEMLSNSLQRYVLEEMTLVVNLFGGHDFDDLDDEPASDLADKTQQEEIYANRDKTAETDACGPRSTSGDSRVESMGNERVFGGKFLAGGGAPPSGTENSVVDAVESKGSHHNSLLASAIRSGPGSVGLPNSGATLTQKHRLSGTSSGGDSSGGGSLKRRSRRKHLSEGSSAISGLEGATEQRVRFGEGAVNLWESLDLMSSPDFSGATRPKPSRPLLSSDLKQAGGTWRQNDVCIQLILSKVKLLFEVADVSTMATTATAVHPTANPAMGLERRPSDGRSKGMPEVRQAEFGDVRAEAENNCVAGSSGAAPISWRFMMFVHDIEVKDKIAASDINKLLYEYCTESMPKRSTQFLTIKNVATINQSDGCEECDLRISLKPLRLNIDQDTLLFLIDFFTTFSKSLAKQQSVYAASDPGRQPTATATKTNAENVTNNLANLNRAKACTTSGNSTTVVIKQTTACGLSETKEGDLERARADCEDGFYNKQADGTAKNIGKISGRAGVGNRSKAGLRPIDVCKASQNKEHYSDAGHKASVRADQEENLDARRQRHDHQPNDGSATESGASGGNVSKISHDSHSFSSSRSSSPSSSATTSSGSSLSAKGGGRVNSHSDNGDSSGTARANNSNNPGSSAPGPKAGGRSRRHSNGAKASGRVVGRHRGHSGSGNETRRSLQTRSSSKDSTSPVESDSSQQKQQHPRRRLSSDATSSEGTFLNHHAAGASGNQQPIYIKSFTFSPDVPIRIDYHAKHWDFEQGALAGILMGLAHLDHSELVLRRVQAKHGMRGLDRVLLFAINSWLSDIKRNQLPSILSGVGPMHSVVQLFQGVRDLFWMPIDHYRKDGRLVRGLQRGASSFSSSTAMAAINLLNRFISIVQCTAQIAHDIVTPPSISGLALASSGAGLAPSNSSSRRSQRRRESALSKASTAGGGITKTSAAQSSLSSSSSSKRRFHNHSSRLAGGVMAPTVSGRLGGSSSSNHLGANQLLCQQTHDRLNQPRNFCEGVAVGFNIIKEGFNDTARNVTVGMQAEDMRSAVGELVRQIPSTLLNPIISATEGAQSVLVGIRNQIAPDARREDQEKWKGRVRGK